MIVGLVRALRRLVRSKRQSRPSMTTVLHTAFPAGSWARRGRAVACIAAYLLLITLPVFALLYESPGKAEAGWVFAMAIGRGAFAMLAAQAVLTARLPSFTIPFGVDIIYYFHRWAAVAALAIALLHYAILRVAYPFSLGPANPRSASVGLTAGRLALILFAVVVATSLFRTKFRISYDRWRVLHAILSTGGIVLAVVHFAGTSGRVQPASSVLWVAYAALWVVAMTYIRILRPLHLSRNAYRVVGVRPEGAKAWTVTLQPDRGVAPAFQPGQYAWLSLGTSPFRAEEHPFSFSGSATIRDALQFTIKELGDFTSGIGQTRPGTIAFVDGPYGIFTTDHYPDSKGFVFIAGGVGIAPIMSMLRTLADKNDPRPLHLFYGNWREQDIIFLDELNRLTARLDLKITYVLQEPPPAWEGESGLITHEILARKLPIRALSRPFFLCGPRAMTDSIAPSLKRLGVPRRHIHFEHFEMA